MDKTRSKQSFTKTILPIIEKALEAKKKAAQSKKVDSVSFDDLEKYRIVKQFMIDKKLKLYGGYAINVALPKESRFYSEHEIPDYDAFSTTPYKHATELAEILYKAGYKYTEIKKAMHEGTFKVFANMWPVADISYKSPLLFDSIETHKPFGEQLEIVTPDFLKISLYQELSSPLIDPARWEKIGWRLHLLQSYHKSLKQFKDKRRACSKKYSITQLNKILNIPLPHSFQKLVRDFFKSKKIIRSGFDAINQYFQIGNINKKVNITILDGLSPNAKEHSDQLSEILKKQYNKPVTITKFDETDIYDITGITYSIKIQIDVDVEYQINISLIEQCFTIIEYRGFYYPSLSSLKYLIHIQIVYEDNDDFKAMYECMLKELEKAARNYYKIHKKNQFDASPFSLYTTKCMGPYRNMKIYRMIDIWKDKTKRFKETRTIFSKGDRIHLKNVQDSEIVIKPPQKKSKKLSNCDNKSYNDCDYPCTVINNKCKDIPPVFKPQWEKIRKKSPSEYIEKEFKKTSTKSSP